MNSELETQKNDCLRNERIAVDRLSFFQKERDEQSRKSSQAADLKLREMQQTVDEVKWELESKDQQLKLQEDTSMRRFAELEKLNALLEQKLQLTEQENAD